MSGHRKEGNGQRETVRPPKSCLQHNISDQAVELDGRTVVWDDIDALCSHSVYLVSNFWYDNAVHIIITILLLLLKFTLMQMQKSVYA